MLYAPHCHSCGRGLINLKNAKTIQIFLPDGNPRSIKVGSTTSRTALAGREGGRGSLDPELLSWAKKLKKYNKLYSKN